MRPTMGEIFEGMNYFLQNDILPELTSPYVKAQALLLGHVIAQTAATCEGATQFPLIKENAGLRVVLRAAGTTLKAAKPDYWSESLGRLTQKIDAELQKKSPSEEDYPTVKSLEEENYNLKQLLDYVILAVGETMRTYESQSLDELKQTIRAHLRKQLNRQLSMVIPSPGT